MKFTTLARLSLAALLALPAASNGTPLPSTPVPTEEPGKTPMLEIYGIVTDGANTPLPAASLTLVAPGGKHLSAQSDAEGKFLFSGLRPGTYRLSVAFLGYTPHNESITLHDSPKELAIVMDEHAEQLKDFVVYGSMSRGQAKALNQQKNALNIVNIVDFEQSSKFPDRNAAESLQRIPGISITRDQGEGEYVMIRGLAPQYNSIQINGARIPSPDKDDERGTGMGLLLTDLMQTMEVSKSSTPDMDADAIGGTVNLNLKEAPNKLYLGAAVQGGYNLQHSDFNHWGKGLGHASVLYGQRYFGDKLGLLVSGSYDQTNIGSILNQYTYSGDSRDIESKRWNDYDVRRIRYGLIVSPDFRFDERNKLRVLYSYNQFNDNEIRRRADFLMENPADATLRRETRNRIEKINTSLLQVSGEHLLDRLKIEYTYSNLHSNMDEPDQTNYRFQRKGLDLSSLSNEAKAALTGTRVLLPQGDPLTLSSATTSYEKMTDRDNSFRLDLTLPFAFLRQESNLKFGAKWLHKRKEYTSLSYTGAIDGQGRNTTIPDGSFGFINIKSEEGYGTVPVTEYTVDDPVDQASYRAKETVWSAYLMGEIKWMRNLTSVVGVRYEHTANDNLHPADGREGSSSYGNLLPSVNLVYNLDRKSNIKLAYSTGLRRPDYSDLVPYYDRDDQSLTIDEGNPGLKAAYAHSFDLLFEHYTNNLGMLTAGVYLKRINDDITSTTDYQRIDGELFEVTRPVNTESSKIWGAEVALNHQFKYLSVPFLRDMGIYANYTYTHSTSSFGGRELTMSSSPEHTGNISLFYESERNGWSFAFTNTFRSSMLFSIGENEQNDQYYGREIHMDVVISKRLWKGLVASFQVNNITDQAAKEYLGKPGESYSRIQQTEYYGQRFQLGLKWTL